MWLGRPVKLPNYCELLWVLWRGWVTSLHRPLVLNTPLRKFIVALLDRFLKLVLRLLHRPHVCDFYIRCRISYYKMRTSLLSIGLLATFISYVSATALTYKLLAHENACFYAKTETKGVKIAFYFAVRHGHGKARLSP